MSRKVYKLVLIFVLLILSLNVSGCKMLAPEKSDNNYILPANNQINDYIEKQNITNLISIDAIDGHYANILYKIGLNGLGFKVITTRNGKVITISDGKTIYSDKIPEVEIGGTGGRVKFRYIHLNDSISRIAYKMKIVYYDDTKNENIEIVEMINKRHCFIYAGNKYNNIVEGFQSISIYGKNGEVLYEK